MKKALSVMLALALLLCCMPALAEETAEYIPYTELTGQYSLEYPAGYQVLDDETVDALLSAMEGGEIDLGYDYSPYVTMIRESNIVYFFDQLTGNNINVVFQDLGGSLSAELIVMLSFPYTRMQYNTMFPDVAYDDEGSVHTVNGVDFARLALHFNQNGMPFFMEQYTVCLGNFLYNITFGSYTGIREAEVEHVVSTFSGKAE